MYPPWWRKIIHLLIINIMCGIRMSKSVTKKANSKHYEQLYPWIQSISNHSRWAAQTCNSDAILLVDKWKSIVHHISHTHEWGSNPKALFPKCVYPALPPEEQCSKKWLRLGSAAHSTLCKVVLQDTLLEDMKQTLWLSSHWLTRGPCY